MGRGSLRRQQDPAKYWEDVKGMIEDSIKAGEFVDWVILLGFEGADEEEELRRIVRVVMEKHKPERGLVSLRSETNNDSGELVCSCKGCCYGG